VVLIGKETHSRPWVNWEIEEAAKQGKRIVGVYEHGGMDALFEFMNFDRLRNLWHVHVETIKKQSKSNNLGSLKPNKGPLY
jgi:hypothetical protein